MSTPDKATPRRISWAEFCNLPGAREHRPTEGFLPLARAAADADPTIVDIVSRSDREIEIWSIDPK